MRRWKLTNSSIAIIILWQEVILELDSGLESASFSRLWVKLSKVWRCYQADGFGSNIMMFSLAAMIWLPIERWYSATALLFWCIMQIFSRFDRVTCIMKYYFGALIRFNREYANPFHFYICCVYGASQAIQINYLLRLYIQDNLGYLWYYPEYLSFLGAGHKSILDISMDIMQMLARRTSLMKC